MTVVIVAMTVVIVAMAIVMDTAIAVFALLFLYLLHPFFLLFPSHPSDSFWPFPRAVLPVKGLL
jgi:hypothetical protein